MREGERQVAPDLSGIRRDHVARYEWAIERLKPFREHGGFRILDLACGIGYGSWMMAEAGFFVTAVDNSAEALAYAKEHYGHRNITYLQADANSLPRLQGHDAAVCFETIEHVREPEAMLAAINRAAGIILASVPNQRKFPWQGHRFHFRHYTRREFAALLQRSGFEPAEWYGQLDTTSNVAPDIEGRTCIVVAKRGEKRMDKENFQRMVPRQDPAEIPDEVHDVADLLKRYGPPPDCKGEPEWPAGVVGIDGGGKDDHVAAIQITDDGKYRDLSLRDWSLAAPLPAPKTVAILGLGPSLADYVSFARRYGNRRKLADEIWGINAVIDVLNCDRGFHMDDVRIQEIRGAAEPAGNIAAMLPWLREHPGPIYTSRAHPDYPGLVDYPLQDVLNSCGNQRYFNSTAAYAVAFAIHLRVEKIMCFGFDFTYPNAHKAEKGRACVEFWLGFAQARGIELAFPKSTTLLDAYVEPRERFYGYDTVDLEISGADGAETVKMTPRPELPTAEEIEERYDHHRHPNALVEAGES